MERFGISVGGQLLEAVRFAGIGVLLGVWYDLFRLVRLLTRPPAWRIFVQDMLYFCSAAAVTMLLALPVSSGRIRLFHLLALTIGAVCYYFTVGRLVYRIARLLDRVLRWIGRVFGHIFDRLAGWGGHLCEKLKNIFKKAALFWKNRLQLDHKM